MAFSIVAKKRSGSEKHAFDFLTHCVFSHHSVTSIAYFEDWSGIPGIEQFFCDIKFAK